MEEDDSAAGVDALVSRLGLRYVLYSSTAVVVELLLLRDGDPYRPPRRLTSPRLLPEEPVILESSLSNRTCLLPATFGVGGVTVLTVIEAVAV